MVISSVSADASLLTDSMGVMKDEKGYGERYDRSVYVRLRVFPYSTPSEASLPF